MNIELNIKPPATRNFKNKVRVLSSIKSLYMYAKFYNSSCRTAFCQYREMPFMMNYLDNIDFENMECTYQDIAEKKSVPVFRCTFTAKTKEGKELLLFYDESSFDSIKKMNIAPRFDIYEEIYNRMLFLTSKKFMEDEYPELIKFDKSLALIPFMYSSYMHTDEDNISNIYAYIKVIGHIVNELNIYNSKIEIGEEEDEIYVSVRDEMDFFHSFYNIDDSSKELYKWSSIEFAILFKMYAKEFIVDIEDSLNFIDLKERINDYIEKKMNKYLSNYNIMEKSNITRKEILDKYEQKVFNR